MAQFQTPQFIEIEDKIFGPLTLKQFFYFAGAGGFIFILFFILQTWLWFVISAFLFALAAAAAFGKYNGQPLPKVAWNALLFFWRPQLYIWKRETEYQKIEIKDQKIELSPLMPSVKKLWQDLMTRKTPIPKREKMARMPLWQREKEKRYEVFRKVTGEKEIARRVDYR